MIYVATVSDDRPADEGRLVVLRKVLSKDDWRVMWSTTVKTDKELVRAWELMGERIVDDEVVETREKEEK